MAVPTERRIRNALERSLHPDEVVVRNYPDYRWVSVTKGEASAKLEFHDGWVNWTDIQSPGGLGWLAAAHDLVRREFRRLGVSYLLASGGAGPSCDEAGLKAQGPWRTTDDRLRWDL